MTNDYGPIGFFEAMSPYERSEWHKDRALTPARRRVRDYLELRVSQMRAERAS